MTAWHQHDLRASGVCVPWRVTTLGTPLNTAGAAPIVHATATGVSVIVPGFACPGRTPDRTGVQSIIEAYTIGADEAGASGLDTNDPKDLSEILDGVVNRWPLVCAIPDRRKTGACGTFDVVFVLITDHNRSFRGNLRLR